MTDSMDDSCTIATATETATPGTTDASLEYISDNVFQLTLTSENLAEILQYGTSHLDGSQAEAELILKNLTAWSPDVAARFSQRSPTTILDMPFRLVFPKDALVAFDSGLYVRQYLAISYCWHSGDYPHPNYKPYDVWPFSKPWVEAILGDKDHPREGIWLDQLCIDQNDDIHKQKSIAAMDVIYRSCIRLLVLLEDVTLTDAEAHLGEVCDPTKRPYDSSWLPEPAMRPTFASFYEKVNSSRWWDRAWCFHEFSVNEPWSDKRQCNTVHNATFIMNGPGGSIVKMKWFTLHSVMVSAMEVRPAAGEFGFTNSAADEIMVGRPVRDDTLPNTSEVAWKSSIMAYHNRISRKGCKNPADRISIMLNMSGRSLAYTGPDIENKERVFSLSSLLALAAGETYPLSTMGSKTLSIDGMPTWLSQEWDFQDVVIPHFQVGGVKGIHSISTQEIELRLIFFMAPLGVMSDEEALKLTLGIFPKTIPTTQPTRNVPEKFKDIPWTHTEEELDMPRRRFLATCILNGGEFMSALWKQLLQDVVKANYNQGVYRELEPSAGMRRPAQKLLDQLYGAAINGAVNTAALLDLEDAQIFLTWLTDPRSMYYIGYMPYRIQSTIEGRHAIITSVQTNENFNQGPFGELRVAIPTDLLNVTCVARRIWILRPVKTDGETGDVLSWRIVAKALLLGEPDLTEEVRRNEERKDSVVTLGERAVVCG